MDAVAEATLARWSSGSSVGFDRSQTFSGGGFGHNSMLAERVLLMDALIAALKCCATQNPLCGIYKYYKHNRSFFSNLRRSRCVYEIGVGDPGVDRAWLAA
jgi:hypothetical protein